MKGQHTGFDGVGDDSRSYRLVSALGHGGFGSVYRGELRGPSGFLKTVAIKVLNEQASQVEDFKARLRDEARLLALLRHRAIVHVEDLVRIHGRWAVVMEFVEGADLKVLLTLGRLPPRPACELAAEVASALEVAHEARDDRTGRALSIVHRDIKPANIRITPSGEVKVLDFGVARAAFTDREAVTRSMAFGSMGYLAPERFDGNDTPAADIFALGVVVLESLLGEPMGQPSINPRIFRKKVEARLAVLESRSSPALADGIIPLLRSMLSYEAEERPSTPSVADRFQDLVLVADGPWLKRWMPDVILRLSNEEAYVGALDESPVEVSGPGLLDSGSAPRGGAPGVVDSGHSIGSDILLPDPETRQRRASPDPGDAPSPPEPPNLQDTGAYVQEARRGRAPPGAEAAEDGVLAHTQMFSRDAEAGGRRDLSLTDALDGLAAQARSGPPSKSTAPSDTMGHVQGATPGARSARPPGMPPPMGSPGRTPAKAPPPVGIATSHAGAAQAPQQMPGDDNPRSLASSNATLFRRWMLLAALGAGFLVVTVVFLAGGFLRSGEPVPIEAKSATSWTSPSGSDGLAEEGAGEDGADGLAAKDQENDSLEGAAADGGAGDETTASRSSSPSSRTSGSTSRSTASSPSTSRKSTSGSTSGATSRSSGESGGSTAGTAGSVWSPPPPANGSVVVRGVARARLKGSDGRTWSPGEVPEGVYDLAVTFDDGSQIARPGFVFVDAGKTVTVRCDMMAQNCR